MRKIVAAGLLGLVCLALPAAAVASVGVGIGTGRIVISEKIKSGSIYSLPPVTVFNTGTQKATYTMAVTLNEKQAQLKPDPKWFSFSPRQFTLQPGKSQTVIPTLHPPLATPPGSYFAYLEAHPAQTVKQGTAAVGVAAATKLSFSVVPSNVFLAIYYRIVALYRQYEPWSQLVSIGLVVGIIITVMNKYLLNLRAALKAAWTAGRKR
jgi:P pilus assembly chaperone PapD